MKLCVLLLICCGGLWTVEACFFGSKSNDNSNNRNQVPEALKFSPLLFPGFLYEEVKKSQPQNFVLSPLSVRNALAMLSLGAMNTTAEEIQQLLQFSSDAGDLVDNQSQLISSLKRISSQNPGVTFMTADKIYAKSGLGVQEQFQKDVNQLQAEIETVDFGQSGEAAEKINSWVLRKTEGKIGKIVDSSDLTSQTSLLVLNTIYFKGFWKNQFPPSNTRKQPFFTKGKQSVDVEMMTQENEFHYAYLQEANAQVVLLPYQGERLSMMIYLPNEASSLSNLENWMKSKSTFDIQKEHLKRSRTVSVSLPKFKIRSSLQLNEPLKNLGLRKMFDAATADFGGIFEGSGRFFVSKVSQETFIEVNEEGTEAAAATGFEVGATSYIPTPQFVANRPFLFQLVDSKTKTVLFSGRVKNPLAQ